MQVVAVLDADRDADQRIGDAHLRAPLGPISQKIVCATGIASVRLSPRFDDEHDDREPVQEVEAVEPSVELEREQPAEAAEQRLRQRVLRMRRRAPGSRPRAPADAPARNARERLRVGAVALHAQRERLGADGDVVRLLGGQRAAPVAQALLADLRDAPQRGRRALVGVGDVRPARPVEHAGVGDAAGERVAVAADVLRQRVDDEPRARPSSAGTATARSSYCRRRRAMPRSRTARRSARGRRPACAGSRSSRRTRAGSAASARAPPPRRRSRRRTSPACRARPAC